MKKIFITFTCLILLFSIFAPLSSNAQESKKVYISFFYGNGCPHCAREEAFLDKLALDFPNVELRKFEVWYNRDNIKLFQKVGKELNISISSVPLALVGSEMISGYLNDATTGMRIKRIVQDHLKNGCVDIVGQIQNNEDRENQSCEPKETNNAIDLPILGRIDPQKWSLPLLTVVVAAIDGFNPCAMWVLVFLISLLIGMEDRKKMWILGSAFIFSSGIVYFLFLSAWLNFFLFLGFVAIIRIVIGLVAVGSGGYHLKEWWTNREGVCKATDMERKQKIMDRFKRVVEEKNFILALGGIIAIAVAVNMIELVCSAGLPAIYTHVLSGANLSPISYYLYLIFYIIIFMLDDMFIFVIAMTTLQITGISTKYSRWSNLIGGIVILILGLLLIFKPEWVMFA